MGSKGFMDKIFGNKPAAEAEEYTEIDLSEYEQAIGEGPAETYVRVAELTSLAQIPELKREIYNGNIVIVDITPIKGDSLTRDRALKDLKQVAIDVNGDIAGLGENQIIVTPMSIKIDRTKFTAK
ncbi:hypothetical protein CUJ83_00200 [Methanocella sp. CWC-04]|uniref:Cell division protein SepF n=1 Tax=Methanooceanicella nereidis TaxID=2052831 RepID=A0AAP2R9K0_9EURY|nr:cell division protein SepF [Methanocella sp. CWC-04]MCD1293419.1 hypothetical protein [Methanocella sp. CWC-04]